MTPKYKMLVLDLDDTLLNDDHEISQVNIDKLIQAQEHGVMVVLASGRPTAAMVRFAEALNLKKYGSYLLAYNGAQIVDLKDDSVIFEQPLTLDEIQELYAHAKEYQLHIITYLDGKIISESESEYIDIEEEITGMPLRKVERFLDVVQGPSIKCLLLQDPEHLESKRPVLQQSLPHLSITTSKPFFLEVTQKNIDKAASLDWLGKKIGVSASEMIAVGNAGNDLTMVQYAGLGVWVNNVADHLRPFADVIVASNNDHGVAEVVDRYLFA